MSPYMCLIKIVGRFVQGSVETKNEKATAKLTMVNYIFILYQKLFSKKAK